MKKIVRLTENDLVRLVKRVINERDVMDMIPSWMKGSQSSDCLKDFKIEEGQSFKGGNLHNVKTATNKDGVVIYWDYSSKNWFDTYEKFLPKTSNSLPKKEIGKWKCVNGKFTTYDSSIKTATID